MEIKFIKLSAVVAMLLLIALSPAWSIDAQSMMGGGTTTTMMGGGGGGNTTTTMMGGGTTTTMMGGGGNTTTSMMGGGMTTTIPGGGGNTTTTIRRGGMGGGGMIGGGGMMGGSSRMGQFVTANLDNDINNIPEIVTIVSGRTLVIMNNEGTVLISKPLPAIPELTNQRVMASGLQVADMDGDGTPEIVTTYYVTNYGFMWGGTSATSETYLVIMTNQGDLKDYYKLQLPY